QIRADVRHEDIALAVCDGAVWRWRFWGWRKTGEIWQQVHRADVVPERNTLGRNTFAHKFCNPLVAQPLHLPRPRIAELAKAQARSGLALAGKELLHKALLVGLEGVEPLRLQLDQLIER